MSKIFFINFFIKYLTYMLTPIITPIVPHRTALINSISPCKDVNCFSKSILVLCKSSLILNKSVLCSLFVENRLQILVFTFNIFYQFFL